MIKQDISYTSEPNLVIGDGVQTDSVVPTTGTNYKRGDLLVVSDKNVATHSADGTDWHVICAVDVTAEQVEKHLTAKKEIPVYTQGEINVEAVRLQGVLLTEEQRTQARARANTATAIELRQI
ncbi:hypothetical protein LP123_07460 [Moraxella bovis]|uniref:Head decoration protein n=1 Tax=Moraxella bovis TaxID=476 RepID=A0AAX3EQV1_MORBO|nr:hypothetical protein [Moraxella bovis]UYZ69971.1 hypothetical protein LP089_07410 [Moraxella bovis]UYZ74512.1 hypothetical protein LP093_06885 [Moraxella bovis]UYZ79562.1 hypothetical protein LP115_07015 [Moraxella bovis]UYZ79839.1 hypothetical protein LP113_07145 [Moraxella bovis]UYZ88044.1 hypothetical protein LP094_07025 [Moraxella bovis]